MWESGWSCLGNVAELGEWVVQHVRAARVVLNRWEGGWCNMEGAADVMLNSCESSSIRSNTSINIPLAGLTFLTTRCPGYSQFAWRGLHVGEPKCPAYSKFGWQGHTFLTTRCTGFSTFVWQGLHVGPRPPPGCSKFGRQGLQGNVSVFWKRPSRAFLKLA